MNLSKKNYKQSGFHVKDSKSISKAFNRLCKTPLGTELNFGTTGGVKNFTTLERKKAKIDDARVVLFALYKFAEATDGCINLLCRG